MSRADDLRAELELIQLEEDFVKAKKAGTVTMEQKLQLRGARKRFRLQRADSATVDPEAVTVDAAFAEIGG